MNVFNLYQHLYLLCPFFQALDILLDMSALSDESSVTTKSLIDDANSREDSRIVVSSDENVSYTIVCSEG